MATQNDAPVKVAGKLYRFISNGEQAGLFAKDEPVQKLTVTEQGRGRMLPAVTTEDGEALKLARAARPCSCKGAPWSTSYRDLEKQL